MNNAGTSASNCAETVPSRTLGELIKAYTTHKVSTFHKLRYHNRKWQTSFLKRVDRLYGHFKLNEIRFVTIKEWHMDWLGPENKVATAHSLISSLRTLCGFGLSIMEDEECERLCLVLNKGKFPQCEPRTEFMTADQCIAIRKAANERCRFSIALAQALQFELILRQRDIVGEWVPVSEPGVSGCVISNLRGAKTPLKWLRGVCWEEIDENMILRHVTSKKGKMLEIDLKLSPMVIEELGTEIRSQLPASGPIILSETTGYPYHTEDFRKKWRAIANAAGMPKTLRNQDSRAGGITEATRAGADLEHVRHAATHADISQTQRYSRGASEKVAKVQAKRLEHRNKDRYRGNG